MGIDKSALHSLEEEGFTELGEVKFTPTSKKKKKRFYKSPYKFFFQMEWSETEAITWCHFVNYKFLGNRKDALQKINKFGAKRE